MTMTANNQRAVSGISSALHVPVTHGNKKGESSLFRGVAKRNGTPVPIDGAAFCSREENASVVIGVNTCERCATSGKGGKGGKGGTGKMGMSQCVAFVVRSSENLELWTSNPRVSPVPPVSRVSQGAEKVRQRQRPWRVTRKNWLVSLVYLVCLVE